MDIHSVPGVRSKDVAEAHRKDLLHQHEFECNCMTYWIDEERETIFCLIEASNKDAVKNMHKKAHGLIPHKIIEVSSTIVQSFLGRIYDPDDAVVENGVKIFTNPGFRIIVVSKSCDHAMLQHCLGAAHADQLISRQDEIFRKNISLYNGSEAEHSGDGFVISFESASQAVSFSLKVLNDLSDKDLDQLDLRIAVNGGEPIETSNILFGDAIQFGNHLCFISGKKRLAFSSQVRDLVSKDVLKNQKAKYFVLPQSDEDVIRQLFSVMEENYHDANFELSEFSKAMAMSNSQLYRRTTMLTGLSTNNLLREFRLGKAIALLKTQRFSISQISTDTGFSSPSYFTKCFKERFGLRPMEYIDLLRMS